MITDEQLSALMDGELADDEAAAIRKAVADDAGLAARLERLRAADRMFQASVRRIDAEPPPSALTAVLSLPPAPVVELASRRRRWVLPAAIAASLVAGAFGGMTAGPRHRVELAAAGPVEARSPLAAALARTPSGAVSQVGGAAFAPVATFRTREGGLCREFRLQSEGRAARAVACRVEGGWAIEVAMRDAAKAAGAYSTASGDTAPIDAFVDRAMIGEALSPAEEGAALSATR